MSKHVMQHKEEPTWCIKCGRFDIYCDEDDCEKEGDDFDSRKPDNYKRMEESLFGNAQPTDNTPTPEPVTTPNPS